jgi:hypothetical protein
MVKKGRPAIKSGGHNFAINERLKRLILKNLITPLIRPGSRYIS